MTDWATILRFHGDRVWRTIYRILNHDADAHDCYQETFFSAWQLDKLQSIDHWEPLLDCLATRKAIDRLRKRFRDISRMKSVDTISEPVASSIDPSQSIYRTELLNRLRVELQNLPEKQAEVFWLSCVEEWPNDQIAKQMTISSGEVRVLLHRARSRLQTIFATEQSSIAENP
jgi:RNA polymerase sigma-70 factor, ECF subfamily